MSKKTSREEPCEYEWVRAWGGHMGSHRWYIESQVADARADRAPENAIYVRHEAGVPRSWATTDDILSNATRAAMGLPLWRTRPMMRVEFSIPYDARRVVEGLLNASGVEFPDGVTFTDFAREIVRDVPKRIG